MTHRIKINYLSQVGPVTFFCFAALLISCAAPEKRLEKEQLTLVYRSQSILGSEIRKLRLEHPIKISNEQIRNHLLSLHYQELSLLGKKKYIFSSNDVLEITPLITKALNRMKTNNILYYEVDTSKGTTSGSIFRAKGKIHWQFKAIKGVNFSNTSFPGFRGSTWRLLPINGQKIYGQSKNIFGSKAQENWITSSLELPVESKRGHSLKTLQKSSRNTSTALEHKGPKNSPVNQRELKKRLQFLKELSDQKLINNREYEHKRKALLDQFL